ncbi:hypothetical protein C7T35_01155 [Variovorax sp. WS11]|uniref:hypothetical protein n=1 Tax=Variovorax sp. WS11 TaxID=1105204 RepID=UPI000D0DA3D0|nr:hypothetical protein [Variovorax sp. WS11]NDZ11544.1 hypothetical protein [Variovorax sp. WS11]PSL86604.1 hypothetical protein C7T35_01155 [Variovorax sp. WS11]
MNDAQLIEHLHARGYRIEITDVPMIREACAALGAELGAPDIPLGCEMARGWAVEVTANGQQVLLLSDRGYSGLPDLEPWASTIRGCAEHLQAFIGPAEGRPAFDPNDESTGEADAIDLAPPLQNPPRGDR